MACGLRMPAVHPFQPERKSRLAASEWLMFASLCTTVAKGSNENAPLYPPADSFLVWPALSIMSSPSRAQRHDVWRKRQAEIAEFEAGRFCEHRPARQETHRGIAGEGSDNRRPRLPVQIQRRGDLLDLAAIHDDKLVGNRHGLELIMRHMDRAGPEPLVQELQLALPLNLNRARPNAAMAPSMVANTVLPAEMSAELTRYGMMLRPPKKALRMLSSVGSKKNTGGHAKMSL